MFGFGVALAGCALLSAPIISPDGAACAAIAMCDEADVEPIYNMVTMTDDSPRIEPAREQWTLRGDELRRFCSLLEVTSGHGARCWHEGDYRFRFTRWGVPLAQFRAHIYETPAHMNGSFGLLLLDSPKANELRAFLSHLSVDSSPKGD